MVVVATCRTVSQSESHQPARQTVLHLQVQHYLQPVTEAVKLRITRSSTHQQRSDAQHCGALAELLPPCW